MRRKKQGASLIMVTIVFMFLSTVSFAMLSMVLGNYKARISESNRVENLYASDSGLDVAYNIIGKTFDGATKYGYYKVLTLKDGANTGPNNDKYQDINTDIKDLNDRITHLENQKKASKDDSNVDLSDFDKKIGALKLLIKEDEALQQVLINEEFKRAFKNFIEKTNSSNAAENIPYDQLEGLIQNHSYVDMSNVNDTNIDGAKQVLNVEFGINGSVADVAPTLEPTISFNSRSSTITGIHASVDGHKETVEVEVAPEKEYYDISVNSTFYSGKLNGNEDDRANERHLQANFKLTVPEFKDIYYKESSGDIEEYLATKDRALTVKGNMNLNEADDFTVVRGEVYVEGTTPASVSVDGTIQPGINVSNRSYEKYNGGIMVYNSKGVHFNNDVVTRNTLNLRSGADVTIDTNLYGSNIYIGGSKYDPNKLDNGLNDSATGAKLGVGQVVIDNDLGVKATGSIITIDDFFGINDKTIKDTAVDRTKSSSSIIVNSDDNSSSININKSLYIMGTAHINTNETDNDDRYKYQTGESIAVKGNYMAYAVPMNEAEKFAYYNPLQLLDDSKVEDKVSYKANHFTNYWNSETIKNPAHYPNTGGIHLLGILDKDGNINAEKIKENIHTVGALVYEVNGEKKVLGLDSQSIYGPDLELPGGAVNIKQAEFASKVYKFNQSATKFYDYDKTILTDFSALVDTSRISSSGYKLSDQSNKGEYAIFNGSSSKEIKIITSDDNTDKITNDGDNIVIKVRKDTKTLNTVIVSAGNVSIESDDININGCIIINGDLNINSKSGIKIAYDSGVIERVQAKNEGLFKAVFGNSVIYDANSTSEPDNSTSVDSSYDLKNFLQKQLWRIIQ